MKSSEDAGEWFAPVWLVPALLAPVVAIYSLSGPATADPDEMAVAGITNPGTNPKGALTE